MFALNPIRLARRVDRCFSSAGVIVRGSDRLRFWRTPLSEKDRQDDDTADGQELALPVLERLEPEGRCGHELHGADGLTPVSRLLRAVVASIPPGRAARTTVRTRAPARS